MIHRKVKVNNLMCLNGFAAVMSSCCTIFGSDSGAVHGGAAFIWAENLDDDANCLTAERADAL